ncbi:MAG: DUF1573 domain-containing protein [Planctomycetota bacterium]|nr:DUF1573 domain-containing protein [Planctomycetota bacterium]
MRVATTCRSLLAVLVLGIATSLPAQVPAEKQRYPWAEKMLSALEHDFGVVARGADTRHRIEITNLYKEDVHIQQITTSCGCTAVRPSKDTLASLEKAYIEITMDTKKFMNEKNSSVTVVFDKPLYAEVRIPIKAYIRSDVVITPGGAEFGGVAHGAEVERKIGISYAGRPEWKIRDIVNKNNHLAVRLQETNRANNRVNYDLFVTLKGTAPRGDFRDQITLVTDDSGNPQIPVMIDARIEDEFTVNPTVVDFGTLAPGAQATKNIVVRGKKPFKVAKIENEMLANAMEAKLPAEAKVVQIVPITLTAPADESTVTETLHITIEGSTEPIECKVFFKVVAKK